MEYSEVEKALRFVRSAIIDEICPEANTERSHSATVDELSRELNRIAHNGVFVTIYVGGRLRGCIGMLDPSTPFAEALERAARSAAARDLRFEAIRPAEITSMRFEITLLGAMQPCSAPEELVVGRHGVMIEFGGRRGILLPKVAAEQRWNSVQFLSAVCEKAGLQESAWRNPAAGLFRFSANAYSEEKCSASGQQAEH